MPTLRRCLIIAIVLILTTCFFVYVKPERPQVVSLAVPRYEPMHSSPLLGPEENTAALWFPSLNYDPSIRVPAHNVYPAGLSRPRTPLLIGFTRSQDLVEQAVLSYVAAGWPRSDIILVDNSGTLDANSQGLLSSSNPFALNYTLFRNIHGISILQTPTLLNFSQLMNFYLRIAISQRWSIFFWTHQDIAVLGDETANNYISFYQRVLQVLADVGIRDQGSVVADREAKKGDWAVKFFAYDWLTLVNVAAWRVIGQWDNFIPYYTSDCDAYSRVTLNGFTRDNVSAGHIFDVSEAMPELLWKLFEREEGEGPNSERYTRTREELDILMSKKWRAKDSLRNSWQDMTSSGEGEPWTYAPHAFQRMWWATADHGRSMYKQKWGTDECRLEEQGLRLEDVFKEPR